MKLYLSSDQLFAIMKLKDNCFNVVGGVDAEDDEVLMQHVKHVETMLAYHVRAEGLVPPKGYSDADKEITNGQ